MKLLEKIEQNSFLVGGAVRDTLLEIPLKDRDFVVIDFEEEQLLEAGFEKVGKQFGVFLHPVTKEEYSLIRGTDHRSLIEDLKCRDLTINSMAESSEGKLIDPLSGAQDLKDKVLRHSSSHFLDDPLRVYRLARFYALFDEFEIADETLTYICENLKQSKFNEVAGERILLELEKSFQSKKPSRFFVALEKMGALEPVFISIKNLIEVPERKDYHPEGNSYIHTLMVLDRARELTTETDMLYSALVHDLGKGITPKEILPHHYGHEHRGLKLIKKLSKSLKVTSKMARLSLFTCKNHLKIFDIFKMRPIKIVNLLKDANFKHGDDFLKKFLTVCFADGLKKAEFSSFKEANFLLTCSKALREVNLKEEVKGPLNKENVDSVYIRVVEKQKESFLQSTQDH